MELMRKQLENGNDLVIVQVSGSGSKAFYSPAYFRLVELKRDTAYTQCNARNVLADIAGYEFNASSSRGSRSRYAAGLTKMVAKFNAAGPKTNFGCDQFIAKRKPRTPKPAVAKKEWVPNYASDYENDYEYL